MFKLDNEVEIVIEDIPIQWIPKIELFYPDLPQFPIMYIHTYVDAERLIACPVVVNYTIKNDKCDASFICLCNLTPTNSVKAIIKDELQNRIGISDKISKQTVIDCCKGNSSYINLLTDLWQYIELSYGTYIPYGRFYEEVYSIPRFVSAWQPKTGRQSEMRMLYNFMSAFGEEAILPSTWSHLEYYIIPAYKDVINKDYDDFPKFKNLYHAMLKIFALDFSNSVEINGTLFPVMPKAWKQNKDDFISNVSLKYYEQKKINSTDKYCLEKLVDAFNRHAWRAAYFISAFLSIEIKDYRLWSKDFFNTFYESGSKLKGYSEKVIACFLQQGFANQEVIPIDTWIETFYQFPLGLQNKTDFFASFDMLGKLERVIWLASQSNKTNMKNFFDILWCQRYGTIGNTDLRGVNPLACSLCRLNKSCVGLSQIKDSKVYVSNSLDISNIKAIPRNVTFACLLEANIPRKMYKKASTKWILTDEFSGYLKTNKDALNSRLITKEVITVEEFINN